MGFKLSAAFFLAALASTICVVAATGTIEAAHIIFFSTLIQSVVFGGPLYAYLRWSPPDFNWFSAIAAGFIIGGLPFGYIEWPLHHDIAGSSWADGIQLSVDGIPTFAGWMSYLKSMFILAGAGALGGLVFFLVWRLSKIEGKDADASPPRHQFNVGASAIATISQIFWVTGIILAVVLTVMSPSASYRTCHAILGERITAKRSVVSMTLDISVKDWPRLENLFENFGAAHSLIFQNDSHVTPRVAQVLGLSLCSQRGLIIYAFQRHWNPELPRRHADPGRQQLEDYRIPEETAPSIVADYLRSSSEGEGVLVRLHERRQESDWQGVARDLIAQLEATWPGKIKFTGSDGRVVAVPPELQEGGGR